MKEENLSMFSPEEIPETDEAKKKKVSINQLQENLLKLMNRDKVEAADIVKETGIPFPTLHGWYSADVSSQLLDLNIKELVDYFDVSIDFIAFSIPKYKYDTFDRQELFRLKDEYEKKI
jgi:hypothetical protein